MNDPIEINGTAISIDICDSTEQFASLPIYNRYNIINKLAKLVEFSLSASRVKLIRYTGDGALLFYPESIGFSATDAAVYFSMEFINNWKKCCVWFSELNDIKIRISLDCRESVYTNDDGGQWVGNSLNVASNMKNKGKDENRVLFSDKTLEGIEKRSVYAKFFGAGIRRSFRFLGEYKTVKLYTLDLSKKEDLKYYIPNHMAANIAVCIIAVKTSIEKLRCVLSSIEAQSIKPAMVVIATEYANINKYVSSLNIEYINVDSDKFFSKERSYVRNALTERIKESGINYACFLDGDTVLSKKVMELADNIFRSSPNTVFSIPRIDFDVSIGDDEANYVTNVFLEEDDHLLPSRYFSYINNHDKQNKTSLSDFKNFYTLPSYALFLPTKTIDKIGDWDTNFVGWGEEDVDYTYRLYLNGCRLIVPQIDGFLALHLSHDPDPSQSDNFMRNVKYLLSKHPSIYEKRQEFYSLLGL